MGVLTSINIATYPARFSNLMATLESLKDQADVIRICLNEYKTIPEVLKQYDCYIPTTNLTDNGKFLLLSNKREYYFSCDDDITYPPNYVAHTVSLINKYKCIITYHGRLLQGLNLNYYRGHKFWHCNKETTNHVLIDVAGTGVTAFDTLYFNEYPINTNYHKMSDVVFSHAARHHKIMCAKKFDGWIKQQVVSESIYQSESRTNQSNQIKLSNEIYRSKNRFFQHV
jgi:hypothetical protein